MQKSNSVLILCYMSRLIIMTISEKLFQGVAPIVGAETIHMANGDEDRRRNSAYSKSFNLTSIKNST